MSAQIEQRTDGQWSFVGAREPAWHKLGKIYENIDGLTIHQVCDDLDVGQVVGVPVQGSVLTDNGVTLVEDPAHKMTVRIRESGPVVLGVVGKDRAIIDERTGFAFLDNILDSGEALVSSAGLLDGGRRAFCCMKLPTNVLVGGVDEIEMYVLIALSHDSSMALTAAVTPIRTVCQNTLTYGLQQAKHVWRVRHTKNATLRIQTARETLELSHAYVDAWQAEAEALIAAKVDKRRFESIVTKIYAPKAPKTEWTKATVAGWDQKLDLFRNLWTADTQDGIKGTAWGALNAVAEFEGWYRVARGADDFAARRFQRSLESAMTDNDGPISRINQARTLVRAAAGIS